MKKFILIISVTCLISCISQNGSINERIKALPEKQLSSYSFDLNSAVENRISSAPEVLLSYLRRMDSTDRYTAYLPSEKEIDLFREYYDLLPAKYREIIGKKVIGIYFISNFSGGGMSDYVFDREGKIYIVLIFNPLVLHRSLEEWITYRDNSPFTESPGPLATNHLGNKYKGLIHTLIHESSHIFDYYRNATPFTESSLKSTGYSKTSTAFIENVWIEYSKPVKSYQFTDRDKIAYYGLGQKIESKNEINFYIALERTPFVSLYGSGNWAEDFAETFTWFYISKKFGIEYTISISINDNGASERKFFPLRNETAQKRFARIDTEIE